MRTETMKQFTVAVGDITQQDVDAIINPASRKLRGGGGVDGAIHRAGGPTILEDCIRRFPNGLAIGEAGWTSAGDLPAGWVIHTVGPKFSSEQRDAALLKSCYSRALDIADQLGAQSVAFALIGTGAHGWPLQQAVAIASEAIANSPARVDEVRLVVLDREIADEVDHQLTSTTSLRILQGVGVLHGRGYHSIRILPGMSGSGMYWRTAIALADNFIGDDYFSLRDEEAVIRYTTGAGTTFLGSEVTPATTPETVADLIVQALPEALPAGGDPQYVSWYADLMRLIEVDGQLPIAYADYFEPEKGWEIGWGSGHRYRPPPPPTAVDRADLAQWALAYDPYERLCRRPDLLHTVLSPLETTYGFNGTIPDWAGVDLLRAWAHVIASEAEASSVVRAKLNAVAAAIDGHPSTQSFERSPLTGGSIQDVATHRKQLLDVPAPHTYYPPSFVSWLEFYNGYERLARPEAIFEVLKPLITRFMTQQSIPRWAGPDMLRGWMFAMMELDSGYEGRDWAMGRPSFIAAVDAVDRHPATLPGERSPLYRD